MPSVVIVGAGIAGLSTAVRLQQARTDISVTLVADQFGDDTTSAGAAGLFRPTPELIPGVDRDILIAWIEDSWQHYSDLCVSPDVSETGVFHVSGYHMYHPGAVYATKPNLLERLTPNFRAMTDAEWEMFNCKRPLGVCYTSILVEPKVHLHWLMKQFLENGGKVEQRTIQSFEEFAGHYDVLVNCTGLRARDLEADEKLVPNRGQVLRVHAPWIKHFIYVDMDTWIIPCLDSVVIGGTRQHNNADPTISKQDLDDVWGRACQYVPSLRKAKILNIWPGLRPYRTPLRLEAETRNYSNKQSLQILHHYGHGGNGIGISWGTAGHAVNMLQTMLPHTAKL